MDMWYKLKWWTNGAVDSWGQHYTEYFRIYLYHKMIFKECLIDLTYSNCCSSGGLQREQHLSCVSNLSVILLSNLNCCNTISLRHPSFVLIKLSISLSAFESELFLTYINAVAGRPSLPARPISCQ